jgi:hypothetical protein
MSVTRRVFPEAFRREAVDRVARGLSAPPESWACKALRGALSAKSPKSAGVSERPSGGSHDQTGNLFCSPSPKAMWLGL